MKLKDVPNLAEYLPDDIDLESDIDAAVLPYPYVEGGKISALSWAAMNGLSGVVKSLIDKGANVNVLETSANGELNGKTPLFFANSASIARLLIQAGARLNIAAKEQTIFEYVLSFNARSGQSVWRSVHQFSPDSGSPQNARNKELLAGAYKQFFQPSVELADRLLKLAFDFSTIRLLNTLIAEYATTTSPNDISNDFASQPKHIKKQFETYCKDSVKLIAKKERLDKLADVTAGFSDPEVEQLVTQFNVRKRETLLTAYHAQQAAAWTAASTVTTAVSAAVETATAEPTQALAVAVAGAAAHKPS